MTGSLSAGTYIRNLRHVSRRDVRLAGGKAATLGELIQADFPVPDGFVLTTAAFERFLSRNSFAADSSPQSVEMGHMPDDVAGALRKAVADLGNVPLVVRSSGVAEDLPVASFAGQYVTVLDVHGFDAVTHATKKCWASAFSEHVVAYQAAHGQHGVAAMAILVQRLVRADAAGVAFTADPVSGDRAVTMVSAVRGLGERLVSGQASPDEWTVRDGEAVRKSAPEQAIGETQVLEIARLARAVERHFGTPQDIEWAISGDALFLLQSRPITTLGEPLPVSVPAEPPPGFWRRETSHYPRPISPMFRTVQDAFNASIKRAAADFSLLMEGIEFREIGGWVYQRMVPLGGKDRPMPPSWLLPLLIRIVPLMRSRIRGAVQAVRSDKAGSYIELWHAEWKPELIAHLGRLQRIDLVALSDAALDKHVDGTVSFFRHSLNIHTRLNFAVLIVLADIGFACRDLLGWDERKTFDLFAGLSEKSSEPARRLAQLAHMARSRPAVRELLEKLDAATAGRLVDADKEFAAAFAAYRQEFGSRALRIEIADQTLAEEPALILRLIRDQLARRYDPAADMAALEQKRMTTLAEARSFLGNRSTGERERFERALTRGEQAYPVREDNQFYTVSSPLAVMRYAVLEFGRRLADRRQISGRADVFFLELEEARSALRTRENFRPLVERRKQERAWVEAHPGPAAYGKDPGSPPPFDAIPREAKFLMEAMLWAMKLVFASDHAGHRQADARMLHGIAASPGIYTGTVRIIMNEAEFNKLQPGDVLVCPITSPVWSVLFPSVGALVTDTGGILSHPAIIAREYRVPAVVAAGNATALLRDGQTVTVDGNRGIVEIGN